MTKPLKIFLVALLVVTGSLGGWIAIQDRDLMDLADKVRTFEDVDAFALRVGSGKIGTMARNHGATTLIVKVPYFGLPFFGREYRWCQEYKEITLTFDSEMRFWKE